MRNSKNLIRTIAQAPYSTVNQLVGKPLRELWTTLLTYRLVWHFNALFVRAFNIVERQLRRLISRSHCRKHTVRQAVRLSMAANWQQWVGLSTSARQPVRCSALSEMTRNIYAVNLTLQTTFTAAAGRCQHLWASIAMQSSAYVYISIYRVVIDARVQQQFHRRVSSTPHDVGARLLGLCVSAARPTVLQNLLW